MRRNFKILLLLLPALAAGATVELRATNNPPAPTPVELRHEMKDIALAPTHSERSMLAESTNETVWVKVDGSKYMLDFENNTATLTTGADSTEVVIPATVEYEGQKFSVTAIGVDAFNSKRKIVSVEIPSSVTSIGEGAFLSCSSLQSIEIPSSVAYLGYSAFDGCKSLAKVVLSESLKTIGYYTFRDCSALDGVSLPSALETISFGAFRNCTSLSEIFIPTSVVDIKDDAFSGCSSMASFIVDEENQVYSSSDGALLSKDGTQLLHFPLGREGKYTIPATVTTIPDGCGVDCRLSELVIPAPVATIGKKAFNGSLQLQIVNLGASVESIGAEAFFDCPMLSNFVVEEGNPAYSSADGVLFKANQTELLMMPKSREGTYNVPNTVKTIGEKAFYATGLSEIILPESVDSIGKSAFAHAEKLTSMALPKLVREIKTSTFSQCKNLKNIDLPENLTFVESYAFEGCSALESIVIPHTVWCIDISAFQDCSTLTSVSIPNSVTYIGRSAFQGCSSLMEVEIPVSIIMEKTFSGCSGLTSVVLCNSVTEIGTSAFQGCSSLREIEIPVLMKSVGELAFDGCTSLETVRLPYVISLGNSVFKNCVGISHVYACSNGTKAMPKSFNSSVFPAEVYTNATLHVPADLMSRFKITGGWSYFKNREADQPNGINALSVADDELRVETRADGAGLQVCAGNGGGSVGYVLYAVGGQRVGSGAFAADGGWHTLSVGPLAAGVYVLNVDCGGTVKSHKFIVK